MKIFCHWTHAFLNRKLPIISIKVSIKSIQLLKLFGKSYPRVTILLASCPLTQTALEIAWKKQFELPSTHQCTIQKILFLDFMDGMKLSPQGSVSLVSTFFLFLLCLFSGFLLFFSRLTFFFFFWPFLAIYFLPATPDPKFFFFNS